MTISAIPRRMAALGGILVIVAACSPGATTAPSGAAATAGPTTGAATTAPTTAATTAVQYKIGYSNGGAP